MLNTSVSTCPAPKDAARGDPPWRWKGRQAPFPSSCFCLYIPKNKSVCAWFFPVLYGRRLCGSCTRSKLCCALVAVSQALELQTGARPRTKVIQHLGSQWIRPWRVEVFTPLVQVAPPSIQRDGSTRAVHRIDQLRVTSAFDRALYRTRPDLADPHLTEVRTTVAERHVRMLHLDGVSKERLKPGIHAFWATGPVTTVKLVDMRQRAHDVSARRSCPRFLVWFILNGP